MLVRVRQNWSASIYEGPQALFVKQAALNIVPSSIISKYVGSKFSVGPYKSVLSSSGAGFGCFPLTHLQFCCWPHALGYHTVINSVRVTLTFLAYVSLVNVFKVSFALYRFQATRRGRISLQYLVISRMRPFCSSFIRFSAFRQRSLALTFLNGFCSIKVG